MFIKRLNIVELALIQLILYVAAYLWNPHIGFLLCLIFAVIALAILMISYVIELIERSKVPKWYYKLMWVSVLSPLLVLVFFSVLDGLGFLSQLP